MQRLSSACAVILLLAACGSAKKSSDTTTPTTTSSVSAYINRPNARIVVTSTAFKANAAIPKQYTCDGTNAIAPIAWTGAPADATSVALIVDDPDAPRAGGFLHWAVVDLPVAGHVPPLPADARQLPNGAGQEQWTGPCPPSGKPHHYHFTIYALNTQVSTIAEVKARAIARGELVGTYRR